MKKFFYWTCYVLAILSGGLALLAILDGTEIGVWGTFLYLTLMFAVFSYLLRGKKTTKKISLVKTNSSTINDSVIVHSQNFDETEYDTEDDAENDAPTEKWDDTKRRNYYESIGADDIELYQDYQIVYTDFHGNTTERKIKVIEVKKNKRGDLVIEAWCDLRDEMRTFKVRNIDEMYDLETGDILI